MTTAIIDGDIVAYRCAAASEDTDLEICCLRADKLMQDIIFLCEASDYKCYLTGQDNFRKKIYPEYKANRKDKPKPQHLQALRTFLVENWSAIISDGCEADDKLGIAQIAYYMSEEDRAHWKNVGGEDGYISEDIYVNDLIPEETIICSIDKDLLQIPGRHFNWVKSEFYDQTEFGGIKHFYLQLLQGDRGDNIPGVDGIGPKKAERFLEGCETEQDLFDTCLELYKNDLDTMIRNGKLLWIWRKENDIISEVAERIEAEDFFLPRHQLIFSKVLTLYKASKQVTAITLYESLQGAEIALSDLLALRDTTPSVQAYKTYVDIVKDYSKKRTIHKLCTETMEEMLIS